MQPLHRFYFKISEIIFVMEKGTISAGFGQIFGSAGMSIFQTLTCVNVMHVKCQYAVVAHYCLASLFTHECITNNMPNNESVYKILFC